MKDLIDVFEGSPSQSSIKLNWHDTSVLHRNVLECVVHVHTDFKGFSFLSETDIFYGFAEVIIFAMTSDFFFSH